MSKAENNPMNPLEFKVYAEKQLRQAKDRAETKYEKNRKSLIEASNGEIEKLDKQAKKKEADGPEYKFTGASTGFVLALATCIGSCSINVNLSGETALSMMFLFTFLGFLIGALIGAAVPDSVKADREKIEKLEAKKEEDLNKLRNQYQEEIKEIKDANNQRIEQNARKYETSLRAKSAKYALSPVAQEIIEMLLNNFKKQIRASDRRPHVARVEVPFSFTVFPAKVDSSFGSYDFQLKRVEPLNDLDEQAELAMAIASNIRSDIVMTFPKDPSGGEVNPLEMTFEYGGALIHKSTCYVKARMTYSASNANFVELRHF